MKQAIGYIRVSTEKQANEGVSLEAQEAKIVTWCKANGYELVQVYVDAGISGKRMDTRKELLAALEALFHETNQQNLSVADKVIAKAKAVQHDRA